MIVVYLHDQQYWMERRGISTVGAARSPLMKDLGWWVFDTITNEINSRVVNLAPRCIQQVVVVDDDNRYC